MRDSSRIKPFMEKMAEIWEKNCPDWRFGQLMSNVLNSFDTDPFFIEEDDMIKRFEKFFEDLEKQNPRKENLDDVKTI